LAAECTKTEKAFEVHAKCCLSGEKERHLIEKFPRSEFDSPEDWAEAVNQGNRSPRTGTLGLKVKTKSLAVADLWSSSATLWGDMFKQELALDERTSSPSVIQTPNRSLESMRYESTA